MNVPLSLEGQGHHLVLLSSEDEFDPLLMDEDELMDLAYQDYDERFGDTSSVTRGEDWDGLGEDFSLDHEWHMPNPGMEVIERGGILHRFASDRGIREFCFQNYLENPQVSRNGEVNAWCPYKHEWVQIGWIS